MPLPQKKLIPGIMLMLVIVALAAPPLWWSAGDPPVIDVTAAENNHGPANIGQAKHMAKSAIDALHPVLPAVADEIEADLTGGTNPIVDFTIPDPKTPEWIEKQKAPLLIGQLKAIADPFYTRLNAAAPAWLEAERTENGTNNPGSIFPWTTETTDDANKALANIGQLKAVFSLRFDTLPPTGPVDSDEDGLPDDWEFAYFGDLYQDAEGDADGDFLTNLDEFQYGTDPSLFDTDGDGLADFEEIYWYWSYYYETDPTNWDTDNDGLGDGDEIFNYYTDPTNADSDGDGLNDGDEVTIYGTDPAYADSDNDGLDDGAEINTYGTNPTVDDTDEDGLTDGDEILVHLTDPLNPDGDSDGMPDGWEITYGLDPNDPADANGDLDNDNLTNLEEFEHGSDPTLADTDCDGLNDGDEVNIHGTDPALADSDGDGLSDSYEINTLGTNPLSNDTDGDGISDFTDTAPTANFQNFADADGDGIGNAHDPEPNISRGIAPSIGASSGGAGHLVNVAVGEELNFHVQVSNPAGQPPAASQIKFFLDGTVTTAPVTHLGGGSFVIKWTTTLHSDYPEKIVQLATAKFTDSDGAVAWKNLASIDVAEWEGIIATARVKTSAESVSTYLAVPSHLNGKKQTENFGGSNDGGGTSFYYRGSKEIAVSNQTTGASMASLQIPPAMKLPLFLINYTQSGITSSVMEAGDYTAFPHNAMRISNSAPYQIRYVWSGVLTDIPANSTVIQAYDDIWGYGVNNMYHWKTGVIQPWTNQSWWHGAAFTDSIRRTIQSNWATGAFLPSSGGQRLSTKLPASITPHLAGTAEVPGLPIHPLSIERDNTPFIVESETFYHIVYRVDPVVEDYTAGVKLRLGRTGENYEALPPQAGTNLYQTADGQPLPLDDSGDILLSPEDNSELFANLTSAQGLTLLLKQEATADKLHKLQIRLVSKYYPGIETTVASVDLRPVEVSWKAIDGFENVDDHIDPWTNAKNGKRIFPGFKNPDDTTIRHKLQLVVKTSPALAGKEVYVKAFDVDDSTHEAFDQDIDGQRVIDTTGNFGSDNLPDYLDTLGTGQFWIGSQWGSNKFHKTLDENGEAIFDFRVGMQPGNNYRVVASIGDESGYENVQVLVPEHDTYLSADSSQNAGVIASETLTVWRRLWVENDSMKAIPEDQNGYKLNDLTPGSAPPKIWSASFSSASQKTTFRTNLVTDSSSFNELENGKIIVQGTTHNVTDTGHYGSDGFVYVSGDYSDVPAGSGYRLYDDDDFGLVAPPLPRLDLVDANFRAAFRPAFIEVLDAENYNPVDRRMLEFSTHRGVNGSPIGVGNEFWEELEDIVDQPSCWSARLITAYQGTRFDDHDPVAESLSLGVTPDIGRKYSVIWVETIRDEYDDYLRVQFPNALEYIKLGITFTGAHEIGHMPGKGDGNQHHAEEGVMNSPLVINLNPLPKFTAPTILRFRETKKWRNP